MPPLAPLDDPRYRPLHPPTPEGGVPDVVARWGPRSQLRWFRRFRGQIRPMPLARWNLFFHHSADHRGPCCDSCMDDDENAYAPYGDDLGTCCCVGYRQRKTAGHSGEAGDRTRSAR